MSESIAKVWALAPSGDAPCPRLPIHMTGSLWGSLGSYFCLCLYITIFCVLVGFLYGNQTHASPAQSLSSYIFQDFIF